MALLFILAQIRNWRFALSRLPRRLLFRLEAGQTQPRDLANDIFRCRLAFRGIHLKVPLWAILSL